MSKSPFSSSHVYDAVLSSPRKFRQAYSYERPSPRSSGWAVIRCGRPNRDVLSLLAGALTQDWYNLVSVTLQFRMHDARDVEVLIDTQSTPIIEDCKDVTFGPLSAKGRAMYIDDFNQPGMPTNGHRAAQLAPELAQARLQSLVRLIDSATFAPGSNLSARPIIDQFGSVGSGAPPPMD